MKRTRISEDRLPAVVGITSLLFVIILSLAGFSLASGDFALGVLAGGAISLLNLFWLRNTLKRVLGLEPRQAGSTAQVRYLIRFAAMAIILYLLMVHVGVDIIGLIIGLSTVVIVIMGLSILMLFSAKGE